MSENIMSPSIEPSLRKRLEALAVLDQRLGIKKKFISDSNRVNLMSKQIGDIYFDFSKTHISPELINIYSEFSDQIEFAKKRTDLFSGERINITEDRSVLHTLLRDPTNQGIDMRRPETLEQAQSSANQLLEQYAAITKELDARSTQVTDIIHVGIGGSALGPQLITEALSDVGGDITVHFIGNIDAHQLVAVLSACRVTSTLVIGVSKTFTTAETLQNINSIADWFAKHGEMNPLQNFYAVTAAPDNAVAYGIPEKNVVSFPQWVGGRYSVWSSVSLSAALVFGMDRFQEFLAGAASMDQHFYQTKPSENVCFLAAMLDHYYDNFMGASSKAIFAYDYRLRSLVDYLQQLETESNGKDRQVDGSPVDQETSPVVWGGVGTDVQHSVFQMLHQGTSLIPAEFILTLRADHEYPEHHLELLANGLAQTAALLAGQSLDEVKELHATEGLTDLAAKAKIFAGDKPSTTILLQRLNPTTLGALLAFYEHRTFCGGLFANINSYDQMGVELGKRLAKQLKPTIDPNAANVADGAKDAFDPSTQALITRVNDR
ncbi:glucose-6-phosphate isomerase [Arenicella xantha]|uniref:Glucose-6-phosphate isomerase n=1 Tax=Arenicella xantha TaxID=644221 RepID=A0A395JNA9_9GAMM|nr:glucose-6-phosphate isomerase [Arenicella xantha]RBP53150.1 glucose-6-phosphate isomerase [Arenicella xantha]